MQAYHGEKRVLVLLAPPRWPLLYPPLADSVGPGGNQSSKDGGIGGSEEENRQEGQEGGDEFVGLQSRSMRADEVGLEEQ